MHFSNYTEELLLPQNQSDFITESLQMTNMKRSLSDSEDDDCFDDMKGSPSQSCQVSDRKKRRGVIEKRRRDRINSSLSELRRLVPTAFEKQGSAKLEKAEILQMTVDHLKLLHSKGINGYNNIDPHALAMDYRSIGFRECAAEVARYLVTVEGMDIQDPLRLRLMSHLQCFSAQREAAAKATLQNGSWNSVGSHHSIGGQYSSTPTSMSSMMGIHNSQGDQLSMSSHATALSSMPSSCSDLRMGTQQTDSMLSSGRLPTTASVAPQMPSIATSSAAQISQISPPVMHGLSQMHSQFPVSLSVNSVPMLSPNGSHNYNNSLSHHSVKPYRPWGAELAY